MHRKRARRIKRDHIIDMIGMGDDLFLDAYKRWPKMGTVCPRTGKILYGHVLGRQIIVTRNCQPVVELPTVKAAMDRTLPDLFRERAEQAKYALTFKRRLAP
jgi:hypothetical protein